MKVQLSDDKEKVTVTLPSATIEMSADELTLAIQALSEIRALMKPQVRIDKPNLLPTLCVPDPSWEVWWPRENRMTLVLRHPGMGWLCYLFDGHFLQNFQKTIQQSLGSEPGRETQSH